MIRRALVLAALALGCNGANDPLSAEAQRALRGVGITQAKPADYDFGVCAKGDSMITSHSFTGINVLGETVSGTVCCGAWFKGCTVRF